MPSLMAASATRQPTLPRPTMPSVWPASSKPAKAFLPSSTALSMSAIFGSSPATKRSAAGRLRAASSMPVTTSSFTAFAFAPGALNTGTPRALIGTLEERAIERLVGQLERHVHQRAVGARDRAVVERGAVEVVVDQCRLGAVVGFHRAEAALRLEPLQRQPGDVDRVGGRRVV